jgi:ubiquinol-cytochrome c reductase cytochrome b subunit
MKKFALALILSFLPLPLLAASGEKSCGLIDCYEFKADLSDRASLQRGAAVFVNYCQGCHSAMYSRYERVATDLGIPLDLAEQNLIFDDTKIGDLMDNAMPKPLSKKWFGATPPDLTLVARARGGDWLYTYLLTFYIDDKRPWGVNNRVFKDVGMPHVLLELQGVQRCLPGEDPVREPCAVLEHFPDSGALTADEYRQTIGDLTNFMVYMAEPAALVRYRIGLYVLLFLAFFLVFAWLLNREYWKDVH